MQIILSVLLFCKIIIIKITREHSTTFKQAYIASDSGLYPRYVVRKVYPSFLFCVSQLYRCSQSTKLGSDPNPIIGKNCQTNVSTEPLIWDTLTSSANFSPTKKPKIRVPCQATENHLLQNDVSNANQTVSRENKQLDDKNLTKFTKNSEKNNTEWRFLSINQLIKSWALISKYKNRPSLKEIISEITRKQIEIIAPGLLDHLNKCKNEKGWEIFDNSCGIFHEDMKNQVEFFIFNELKEFKFFRQRIQSSPNPNSYDYLVIKGELAPNFKNFSWRGDNIFIMDCSNIGENVFLYNDTFIGPGCIIRKNTVILNNCFLKNNVEIGESVLIGEVNFFGDGCSVGSKYEVVEFANGRKSYRTQYFIKAPCSSVPQKFFTVIGDYNYVADNCILYKYKSHGSQTNYAQ